MSQTRVAAGPAQTAALLAEVRGLGVVLTPDGDELRVSAPPGVLAGPLVERLRAAKPELLAAVRAESDIPKAAEPVSVLSFAQERMWLQAMLHPEDNAYNLPLRVDLVGRLRPAALRRRWPGSSSGTRCCAPATAPWPDGPGRWWTRHSCRRCR